MGRVGDVMWFWGKPRLAGWRTGFAVRCDYPADGTHELVGFRRTLGRATRFAVADAAFYRRGPLRMRHSVVLISLRDFQLHAKRLGCRSLTVRSRRPRPPTTGTTVPGPAAS